MKRTIPVLLFFILAVLFIPPPTHGEIYQYEDDSGTIHFIDDPAKVPTEFLDRQKIREGNMSEPNGVITRVRISDNSVLVPVTISYRGKEINTHFLLDTGATTCTISPDLAKKLGINLREGDKGYAKGIGDKVYLVRRATLDYVVAGPNRKYDIIVSVVRSGEYDGLLGMNFLRELRYHIDFSNSTINWNE